MRLLSRYVSNAAPVRLKRLSSEYCSTINLPKRDELPLRVVLAFPSSPGSGSSQDALVETDFGPETRLFPADVSCVMLLK